jgi:hypothetical protein
MSSRRSTIQYKPTDVLYLWLLTQPSRPILIGELHLIRTTRGVSLRYAPEWLQRGFPLSEDLPLMEEELIPNEPGHSFSRQAAAAVVARIFVFRGR